MIFSSLTWKGSTLKKSTFWFLVITFIPVTTFFPVILDKNIFWIVDAYWAVYSETYRFVKTTLKLKVCLQRYDTFHKRATRLTSCCKNFQSGGSLVLPLLADLAWDQLVVQLAFFNETKCIGIITGQAEDEKTRLRMKHQVNVGTS